VGGFRLPRKDEKEASERKREQTCAEKKAESSHKLGEGLMAGKPTVFSERRQMGSAMAF